MEASAYSQELSILAKHLKLLEEWMPFHDLPLVAHEYYILDIEEIGETCRAGTVFLSNET